MKSLETVVVASCLLFVATSAHAREVGTLVPDLPASSPEAPPARVLPQSPLDLAFAVWAERERPSAVDDVRIETPSLGHERIVLALEAPRFVVLEGHQPLVAQVFDEMPLLARAWAFAGGLVPAAVDGVVHDMTLELGGDSLRTLTPGFLHDFGGSVAHGPYSRSDDANGTAIAIDVRLVLAWRPDERVRLEAGYAVAYAGGEYGAQLDGAAGHRADFLRHGPWAAVGFDF